MKIKQLTYIVFIVTLSACSTSKVIVLSDKQIAEQATEQQNYLAAVEAWESYFHTTPVEEILGDDFASAGKTAYQTGNSELAFRWLNEARYKNYSDFDMYQIFAEMARKQANISRELTALEFITENFPEQTTKINKRLFEIYYEIDRTDDALNVWQKLAPVEKNEENNLLLYFELYKSLNDTAVIDSISQELLKLDPNQKSALEWNASKYYWKGENRYQDAVETYNKNKTNRQYRILLAELDRSTEDFKKALTYLEKLWELDPGEKYASYFANIYARFGDEEKAKAYQKYLN